MSDCQNMSMDMATPRNVYLSAFYKRSFAFHTVKNRMPVILTQLVDGLVRRKEEIAREYGPKASEDLKKAIGELSKFKYEIQTNKSLTPLTGDSPDVKIYNNYIAKQANEEGHATHFNTIWLLSECYMYRRIKEIFQLTETLKDFDYFRNSKEEAYHKALPLMKQMGEFLVKVLENDATSKKDAFMALLKANLWGNKCDLSISLGKVQEQSTLFDTASMDSNVLCNHSEEIWQAVSENSTSDIVDIILDNSGYELFTDLCLADYLISTKLANHIRIYVKSIPWFISDVMQHDFSWTIEQLQNSNSDVLKELGSRWAEYVKNDTWVLVVDDFWTLPFEFKVMKSLKPELYRKLSESKAAFFKGDLNYRKLFGEINWDPVTSVEEGLQGFHPTKICVVRTIKADIVVGLKDGVAEEIAKKDPKWMEQGDYGLIQFCGKTVQV